MRIDYYLSPLSPWCYLVGDRLTDIAARHGAQIRYRPLDVLALFDRTGGVRPENRHPNRAAYRAQDLPRTAARLGMPITPTPPTGRPNPAPASYAIIAAQAAGHDAGPLVAAILRAHWAEGRDIAADDTLRALLTEVGLDPGLVDSGLFVGAETYARNLEQGIEAGVFGVPFLITEDDRRFWGQDRLEDLDRALGT